MNVLKKITMLLCFFYTATLSAQTVFTRLDGQAITSFQLKGKWVIINYWANWCQPCLAEIQELNRLIAKHPAQVALFAVNFDHLPKQEQAKLSTYYDMRYPSIDDPSKALGIGPIRAVPATFIFAPNGMFYTSLYGGQTYENLASTLKFRD